MQIIKIIIKKPFCLKTKSMVGKPPTGLGNNDKKVEKKQNKNKTPDLMKWKDTNQEVQLVEKVTHKIRNLEEMFKTRWILEDGKL